MQSVRVWSLNHDITTTTSLRLRPTPIFLEIHSHLHRCNSVRGAPHMPLHIIIRCQNTVTVYTYTMNVGCNLWGFGASSMTPQSLSGSTKGNMGTYLGLGKRKYHELMIRNFIF